MRKRSRIPRTQIRPEGGIPLIVFNEKEFVEQNYMKKDFCIKTFDELNAIIRYYIYKDKTVEEIRDIVKKMRKTKTINNYIDDDYVFTGVFMRANSRPLRVAEPIWITKYEYDFVRQIGDIEKEKILFALIVIKKILGYDSVYLTLKEIKSFSMTKRSRATLHKAIDELKEDGFISVYDGKRYKVNTDLMQTMKSDDYICVDDFYKMVIPYYIFINVFR